MPGKSKKGGGLESSPVYKKQKYGTAKSPFTMKGSPLKAGYYDAMEYVRKNPYKVVKTGVKTGARGALGTAIAVPVALYSFGERSIKRKKAGLSGFNLPKPPSKKDFKFTEKTTKSKKNKGFNF